MQKYYYQRLRDIREDNEKTQKEIADVLNTTYQYYSAYERGVRDIPSHHIKTLAQYYNISADYLWVSPTSPVNSNSKKTCLITDLITI